MLTKKDLEQIDELLQKRLKSALTDFYDHFFLHHVERSENHMERTEKQFAEIKEDLEEIKEHVKDHEKRIRKLETVTSN